MDWIYSTYLYFRLGTSSAPKGALLYADDDGGKEDVVPQVMQSSSLPEIAPGKVRVVCLSDIHERQDCIDVPDGDVLILSGDLLGMNRLFSSELSEQKLIAFAQWLAKLPHRRKFVIAGNHDCVIQTLGKKYLTEKIFANIATYLEDSGDTIATSKGGMLSIWGSPLSRGKSKNDAFQAHHGKRIAAIPKNCDVLMTHGSLDDNTVKKLAPRLWVYGHYHRSYGIGRIGNTLVVNASIMDVNYNPSNAPIVVDINESIKPTSSSSVSSDLPRPVPSSSSSATSNDL